MTCLECNKELNYADHKNAMDLYGLELCEQHRQRLEKVVENNNTPTAAVQLYYGLKAVGINPMLEWWDGNKYIDLALSRVKLNIEIETPYEKITPEQAMNDLEEAMQSFKNGFTTIRIPAFLIKNNLQETVNNILGIVEGLRANIKVIV